MKATITVAIVAGLIVSLGWATDMTPEEELNLLRADNKALRAAIETKNAQIEKLKAGLMPPELLSRTQPAPTSKPADPKKEPELKFPWLHEKDLKPLNAVVTMTELERRCLATEIRPPLVMPHKFDIVRFLPEPGSKGLVVHAGVRAKRGINLAKLTIHDWNAFAMHDVRGHIDKAICQTNDDFRFIEVRLYHKGKLICIRNADGFQMAKDD